MSEFLEPAALRARGRRPRYFFSETLDALGAEPDPKYSELEPGLRQTLTVGRPIADG